MAAKVIGEDSDIEIVEAHHRHKGQTNGKIIKCGFWTGKIN
jgi:hypothetical protein